MKVFLLIFILLLGAVIACGGESEVKADEVPALVSNFQDEEAIAIVMQYLLAKPFLGARSVSCLDALKKDNDGQFSELIIKEDLSEVLFVSEPRPEPWYRTVVFQNHGKIAPLKLKWRVFYDSYAVFPQQDVC